MDTQPKLPTKYSDSDRIQIVKKFIIFKNSRNTTELGKLLAKECVLMDKRDGAFHGRDAILEYIKTCRTSDALWECPHKDPVTGRIAINGRVEYGFIKYPTRAEFMFNSSGLIFSVTLSS